MVLDMVIVLILLVAVFVGYCKGALRMLSGLIALVLSLIITCSLSGPVASWVYTDMIRPKLTAAIADKAEEMGADVFIKEAATKIGELQAYAAMVTNSEAVQGTAAKIADVADVAVPENIQQKANETFGELSALFGGVSPTIMKSAVQTIDFKKLTNIAKAAKSMPLSILIGSVLDLFQQPIVGVITPVCFGVIYVVSMLLVSIILNIVISILDKTTVLGTAIKVIGAIMGGIFGIAISLAIALIVKNTITVTSKLYTFTENSVSVKASDALFTWIDEHDIVNVTVNAAADMLTQSKEDVS